MQNFDIQYLNYLTVFKSYQEYDLKVSEGDNHFESGMTENEGLILMQKIDALQKELKETENVFLKDLIDSICIKIHHIVLN